MFSVSYEDSEWIKNYYPDLRVINSSDNGLVLQGILRFIASYSFTSERLYIGDISKGTYPKDAILINDFYQIEITCEDKADSLPIVRETADRLCNVAHSLGKPKNDLHIENCGTCCICVKPELKIRVNKGLSLKGFMEDFVVPFFYAQSYYENVKIWPWGQFSHGDVGILEAYNIKRTANPSMDFVLAYCSELRKDVKKLLSRDGIKGGNICLCSETNLRFRSCHKDALAGLRLLHADCKQLKIKTFKGGSVWQKMLQE